MKRIILSATGLALILVTGCIVTSVNPLYTEKDLVFDPALVGAWSEGEGKDTWAFEKAGEKKARSRSLEARGQESSETFPCPNPQVLQKDPGKKSHQEKEIVVAQATLRGKAAP